MGTPCGFKSIRRLISRFRRIEARHTWRMRSDSLIHEIWPEFRPTSLVELPTLAQFTNVAQVFIKCEGERPLGNFKVLGGMTAAIRALSRATDAPTSALLSHSRDNQKLRLICASDGNHGLAVAAAAARCGSRASIFLPRRVNRVRLRRIESQGAQVVLIDGTYDDAVDAAAEAALRGEGILIADTGERGDDVVVQEVMAGYAVLARELECQFQQLGTAPSHAFIQAGVGGLAAAVADGFVHRMREPRKLLIVEPKSAACVDAALNAGQLVRLRGTLDTSAAMLSCGLASAIALSVLRRHPVGTVIADEPELRSAPRLLEEFRGPRTTPSGAAGLAGFLKAAHSSELRDAHGLQADSSVLLLITEGPLTQR